MFGHRAGRTKQLEVGSYRTRGSDLKLKESRIYLLANGETLEQVTQQSVEYLITVSVQSEVGRRFVQPDLVEGVPPCPMAQR